MMMVRLAKVMLTAAVAALCLLVGYNNIVDYGSNFMFVQHVLTMDTTFPDNSVRASRAIADPRLHHAAYAIIIFAEIATGITCLVGAARMLLALKASTAAFNTAKQWAIIGLAAGVGFWMTAFLVVGAEWFQMWQSQIWNGQQSAFRFVAAIGLILVFVSLGNDD